jgi:SAM-dependent methyltransferase
LNPWTEDLVTALDADNLLLSLLRLTANTDYKFERTLTSLRRTLLLEWPRHSLPLRLAAALASQCYINEYVFWQTKAEQEAHTLLHAEICKAGLEAAPELLLLYALYQPLSALPCATLLAQRPRDDWPEAIREIIERTLLDPLEEIALKTKIESLGAPQDPTSTAVRRQYEENPYPRWVHVPEQQSYTAADYLRRRLPNFDPPAFLDQPIDVLVAGCGTGQHSIIAASTYQNANVTAIDLSLRSLAYAKRMTRRMGINAIQYLQADILELERLETQFQVIESVGVLHHMRDPAAGWSVLSRLLKPGGVFNVGLYSESARQVIVKARREIATLNIDPTPSGIRQFREEVLRAGEDGPFARLLDSYDFFTTSSCRDLIFHVQEHRFTLQQIEDLIDAQGMRFIGFDFDDRQIFDNFKARFSHDKLTNLGSWRQFEALNPDAMEGYVFWCQKL